MPGTTPNLSAELVLLTLQVTAREGIDPTGFDDATPVVGGELLQDSLDVLEFLVALDRNYGVSIRDSTVGQTVLRDLGTLTAYVAEHRTR